MKKLLFASILLLASNNLFAQGRLPADLGNNGGLKVECWTGTVFGTCGSGGGAGTDVNINGVGGTPVVGANLPVNCVVGCSGGTSDSDDGSVAVGQTTGIQIGFNYIYDGSVWRRLRWGQATMTSSVPVTIASDQTALTVTANAGTNLNTSALFLDATFTGRFPASSNPASGETNAINVTRVGSYLYNFNGSTWDRWTGGVFAAQSGTWTLSNAYLLDATYTGRTPAGASPADNESNTNTALSRVGAFNFIFDGSTWDRWNGNVGLNAGANAIGSITNSFLLDATYTGRMPAGASPADAESNTNTALSRMGNFLFGYNGTNWDRLRADTTNGLWVNCKTGCAGSGGTSLADRATFTYGTTNFTPAGGVYNSSITALTSGQAGAVALTSTRDMHVALYDASGNAITPSVDATTNTASQSTGPQIFCNGSAATPSAVGADGRSISVWCGTHGEVKNDLSFLNATALASPDANGYQITPGAASATSTLAASACNILSAASTNSTSCKGSAGNFYGYEIYNTSTTVYYLRLYNSSSAPTCSSGTGFIRSIPIPPAAAAGQVGGAISNLTVPTNYGTGIGYCITGGSSSTDNTNAATGVFGEIRYK